ncbi:hypothetical protein [Pseudoxanthomonas suwonensis]|uniref:hypothetical protein n=1 Tax=Pseudoxanthomonas suwonensis TaxID=314722 RepID=UPI000A510924|nr:hypothetical protein [Pseudoxanthomonas suwonensis]
MSRTTQPVSPRKPAGAVSKNASASAVKKQSAVKRPTMETASRTVAPKKKPAPRPSPGKRSEVKDAHDRYANVEIG